MGGGCCPEGAVGIEEDAGDSNGIIRGGAQGNAEEVLAVESGKAALGADPEKVIGVHEQGGDGVIRQSGSKIPGVSDCFTGWHVGIECEEVGKGAGEGEEEEGEAEGAAP